MTDLGKEEGTMLYTWGDDEATRRTRTATTLDETEKARMATLEERMKIQEREKEMQLQTNKEMIEKYERPKKDKNGQHLESIQEANQREMKGLEEGMERRETEATRDGKNIERIARMWESRTGSATTTYSDQGRTNTRKSGEDKRRHRHWRKKRRQRILREDPC